MNKELWFSTVKLLIFDLDGTLFKSDEANIEAIKRAIKRIDLNISVDDQYLRGLLGLPSPDFYKLILPEDKQDKWQMLQKTTREEYQITIREMGKLYPDVKETLSILNSRRYVLAIYSNSSVNYFNTAVNDLGIRTYFKYAECSEEYNITKIALVHKIMDAFSNVKTAVIGDRFNDYEAAKDNNALSVGVLYGYGKEEPYKADITIKKFSDLLDIFKGIEA